MISEILCVGTELLLGNIVNTNAAYLSQELAALGINVYYQSVVGDNPERLKKALDLALSRSDMVILTGGLGPTYDDLTKETVAQRFGLDMVLDEASLTDIEGYFHEIGRTMTENNKKQAMIPKGAIVLKNYNGTAPGIIVEHENKTVILLPGPPNEMRQMYQSGVLPYLRQRSDHVLASRMIHIFGMGESAVEEKLRDIMTQSQNPTLAPYAKQGEVMLRVTASGETKEKAEALIQPMIDRVRDVIGKDLIYGIDVGSLQNALVKLLTEKSLTVAAAESCTGGLVSKRITEIPGASAVFHCGVCTYSNDMKEKILGVQVDTLRKYGAVSEQTALEMARGVRHISGSDIGISTTGIAGPDGGSAQKPVGTVYVGVSSTHFEEVIHLSLGRGRSDERDYIRYISSSHALHQAIRAALAF